MMCRSEECNLAVQTEVVLQKIHLLDLRTYPYKWSGSHLKKIDIVVQTVMKRSDTGHKWAKKTDLGHFSLQSEHSHSVLSRR